MGLFGASGAAESQPGDASPTTLPARAAEFVDAATLATERLETFHAGEGDGLAAGTPELDEARAHVLAPVAVQYPRVYPAVETYVRDIYEPLTQRVGQLQADCQFYELSHSLAGRIGRGLEPVLTPMGFDWRLGTALIGAFAAKEVFVAQLGIVFSVGETGESERPLQQKLRDAYTPLQGMCVVLFCLISMPCMATVAVTIRESGHWKWGLFQLGYLTALAWAVTTAVCQVGLLLGLGV